MVSKIQCVSPQDAAQRPSTSVTTIDEEVEWIWVSLPAARKCLTFKDPYIEVRMGTREGHFSAGELGFIWRVKLLIDRLH